MDINKVHNLDCLQGMKELPDDFINTIITSPPYNKQKNRKGVFVKDIKYSDITDNKNESEYQIEQIEVL